MSFSDEDIIAFLLGDADNVLADQINARLNYDEELVERVSHFRVVLNHLDGLAERFEPPADLVDKTMAAVVSTETMDSSFSNDSSLNDSISQGNEFERPVVSCLNSSLDASTAKSSWLDSTVLVASLTIFCCLAIPAIVRARFESRRIQCAENLRQTGQALFTYALHRPDRRFPYVASSGPEAFSGVFVIRLNDDGLLPMGRLLPCASMLGIQRATIDSNVVSSRVPLPSLEQYCSASQTEQENVKATVGGDYAYNLGFFENNELVAPKNEGSSYYAILTDAPFISDENDRIVAHDGKGINILFDDGQVRFVNSQWVLSGEAIDHPFRNMLGYREAGIHSRDASLAPSHVPPKPYVASTVSH